MAFGFISMQEGLTEIKTYKFWKDVICEFVVDFLLLAIITMAGASATHFWPSHEIGATLIIAFAGGLGVFVLIEAFGHIQQSVMNPIVGLVFLCTKRISLIRYILYIFADMLGAIAGTAVIYKCCPPDVQAKFGPLGPGNGVTPLQAFGVETILVLTYMSVICGALDTDYKQISMPGLPIGLTVTIGCLVGAPFSGPAMNPIVAVPFAFLSGNWEHHWVYWAGDYLGGFLAISLYHIFAYGTPKPEAEKTIKEKDENSKIEKRILPNISEKLHWKIEEHEHCKKEMYVTL